MTDNTVLFKVEVDSQGAVQGFRVSREELEKLREQTNKQSAASDKNAQSSKRQSRETKRLAKETRSATDASRAMRRVIGTVFAIATVRQVVQYADIMTNLDSRLRVVTDTTDQFKHAQGELLEIANETGSSLESTTNLYARLELALKNSGTAQEDILDITKTLNQAYIVSGATSAEAANSIIQLSQGFAAGALRGDEFRSVMEQAPRVVQALTDSLGLTRGELRELANDGKLTTEVLVAALSEQADVIDSEFGQVTITVDRAFTELRNNVLDYIGDANQATGATELLVDGIEALAENVESIANVGLAAMATGLTVVTLRFGQATIAARGFLFALGPIGIAATLIGTATFAYLEFAGAQDRAADSAADLRDRINEATDAARVQANVLEAIAARDLDKYSLAAAEKDQSDLLDESDRTAPISSKLADRQLQEAVGLQREINLLKESIAEYNIVIAIGEKRTNEFADAQQEARISAKELLIARRAQVTAEKDYTDAIKLAKDVVSEYGDEQERAALINEKYDLQLAKIRKGLVGVVDMEDLLAASILSVSKARKAELVANKSSVDSIKSFKDALGDLRAQLIGVNDEFLPLELMLEEVENQFGESSAEAEELRSRLEALRLEAELLAEAALNPVEFVDATSFGFARQFSKAMKDASEEAGQTFADAFSQSVKDNPQGAAAFGAYAFGAIANYQRLKNQGATGLDAINSTIAQAGIPVVSELAQTLGFINDIFSGGLFGTKYAVDQSRQTFTIDGYGATGGTETDKSKKKAFFGGTKRKTVAGDLAPDTQKAISDLFDAALEALFGAVEALGVKAPEFIAGKFEESFDKDGNLTKAISTFFGRTFEESFEEFGMRLVAENLIAAVGEAVGDVEVVSTVGQSFDGNEFRGAGRDPGQSAMREVSEIVNEAHAIAERWRDDAELLLDGAKLLLSAQKAIQDGDGLLDSLTASVDLVEALQDVGESLIDAFDRIAGSVGILEDALELLDQSFDLSRESFVRYAEEFTDAAGSVVNAAALWGNYFSVFFEADELLESRLRVAQRVSSEELADIGLSPDVGRDEFKRLFEDALPTLSADLLVEWLEAAEALGIVLSLEEQLASIRTDSVEDLITAFGDVRDAVGDILGSTINDLRRELLSPEALHDEYKNTAVGLAGDISGAESRQEVLALVSEINALVRDTRGAAGDTRFNPELIEFLQQISETADIRLGALQTEAIADAELILREIEAREGFAESTGTFAQSVADFGALISAESAIVIGGNELIVETGFTEPINNNRLVETLDRLGRIFDGQDPNQAAATMAQSVETFGRIIEFQAANPPTIQIDVQAQTELPSDIGLV